MYKRQFVNFLLQSSTEIVPGVPVTAVDLNFKVAVISGGIAGASNSSDLLPLRDIVADGNIETGIMGVQSLNAVPVVNDHTFSVVIVPSCNDHSSRRCSMDRSTIGGSNIQCPVIGAVSTTDRCV